MTNPADLYRGFAKSILSNTSLSLRSFLKILVYTIQRDGMRMRQCRRRLVLTSRCFTDLQGTKAHIDYGSAAGLGKARRSKLTSVCASNCYCRPGVGSLSMFENRERKPRRLALSSTCFCPLLPNINHSRFEILFFLQCLRICGRH